MGSRSRKAAKKVQYSMAPTLESDASLNVLFQFLICIKDRSRRLPNRNQTRQDPTGRGKGGTMAHGSTRTFRKLTIFLTERLAVIVARSHMGVIHKLRAKIMIHLSFQGAIVRESEMMKLTCAGHGIQNLPEENRSQRRAPRSTNLQMS